MSKIEKGQKLPSVTLKKAGADGLDEINIADHVAGKNVIIFAVPGAFTPTCAEQHLPSFLENYDDIIAGGVDEIICVAVNDPVVMAHWEDVSGAKGKITMLPDGNAAFTKAIGMDFDGSGFGLGTRSLRYLMHVEDGTVTALQVEDNPGEMTITSGSQCISLLQNAA